MLTPHEQMYWLERIWSGLCLDPECTNYPFHGVKPGTPLRVRLPSGEVCALKEERQAP